MPFKSKAQRRWMYANKPEMAKRWQKHTPKNKKLPERVSRESRSSMALNWHRGEHTPEGTVMWAEGERGQYEIVPYYVDDGYSRWNVHLDGDAVLWDYETAKDAKTAAARYDRGTRDEFSIKPSREKTMARSTRILGIKLHNPISGNEEIALGIGIAALMVAGGLWYLHRGTVVQLTNGMMQSVSAKAGSTVTLKLPAGATWTGVASGATTGLTATPASGNAPYPVPNVVAGMVITATWTDGTGAPGTATVTIATT